MEFNDFVINQFFELDAINGSRTYLCTDVATKCVIAIRTDNLEQYDVDQLLTGNRPFYNAEIVLDAFDFPVCNKI